MILVNTEHTPYVLINSPLVGTECLVSLHYSQACEYFISRHTNPIEEFLGKTSFVNDISKILSSPLKNTSILHDSFSNIKNPLDLGEVKRQAREVLKNASSKIKLRELKHQTKISTLDVEIVLKVKLESLIEVEEEVLNMFYTVVHTKVADLQSDPVSKN